MNNKIHLTIIALIGSFLCWQIIDIFIVDLSFWKYLLIELLLSISKFFYEKEKKRLDSK